MLVMPPPKKQPHPTAPVSPPPPASEQAGKKISRPGKKNINAWIEDDLYDALESFIDAQEVRPTMTAAVEKAIREFLKARGRWPVA